MLIGLSDSSALAHGPDLHAGFPRMVRTHDGDLLLFYRLGTTHAQDDAAVVMRRSDDDGATWSAESVLWRPEPGCSAHNPVAVVTRSGRIVLWASRYEYGPGLRHPCYWSTSENQGVDWSPFVVFDAPGGYNCYYVTDVIHTAEGLLAGDATFPASGVGHCHTRILRSRDDGATWGLWSNLTLPDENRGNEVGLVETAPGTILCILRDRGRTDTFCCRSRDGGRSWSDLASIGGMLNCILQRPFLTRVNERVLLLTGRDAERKSVVAYLSTDSGETFAGRVELDSYRKDGGYTTVVPVDARTFLVAWYSDRGRPPLKPEIRIAKITV